MQRMVTLQEKSNKDYCPKCPIEKWLLKKKVSLPGRKEAKFKCPPKPAFTFPKPTPYPAWKCRYNFKIIEHNFIETKVQHNFFLFKIELYMLHRNKCKECSIYYLCHFTKQYIFRKCIHKNITFRPISIYIWKQLKVMLYLKSFKINTFMTCSW